MSQQHPAWTGASARRLITINPPRRKRILVTGGAGFIGSHLCERLIRSGAEVVCLDNLSTGRRRNLAELMRVDRFEFVEGDVTGDLQGEFDEIYNLACPASPVDYQRDPIATLKTSVVGALNVLELAARTRARVLQASTSEVYGDPLVHPQRETYCGNVNPVGPRACYDEGKRCAETLCYDYAHQRGVEVRVARIFNTYGPRMRPEDGRVVPTFIMQALGGDDLTIFGDGSQTRSFCFVDDLVDGLVRLMALDGDWCGPINLGNPGEFTVGELARMVLALTGSGSRIATRPLPADDPRQRRPDIAKARELLGWQPRVALTEGLARTIADLGGRTFEPAAVRPIEAVAL